MEFMQRLFLLPSCLYLLVCLVGVPVPSANLPPPGQETLSNLEGVYVSEGKDEDGKTIRGAATIYKVGEVFLVQFITAQAGGSKGIGIRQGDTFAVGWVYENKGQGVTLYKIGAKTLSGKWAGIPGKGRMNAETLTFVRGLPNDEGK